MSEWIGCTVSLKCGKGTAYQGEILQVSKSHIHLKKAFCDGVPCNPPDVTILASDIQDLKLINIQHNEAGTSTVIIQKPIPKRNNTKTQQQPQLQQQQQQQPQQQYESTSRNEKTKAIDIVECTSKRIHETTKNINSTPIKRDKNRHKWDRELKNEICFGSPCETKDFDFEKNLALFNKQAIFEEINNLQKPDLVKHGDPRKYRHDENVIATVPTIFRQIIVPKSECHEYVTDDGLVIPSVTRSIRKKLFEIVDRIGLSWERRVELIGRATTEMALQLLGGAHRLNPHNTHQLPVVAFICGSNRAGAMGVNAARQLSSQGVKTVVYALPPDTAYYQQEISLYNLNKNKIIRDVKALPSSPDLIIVGLVDEDSEHLNIDKSIIDWIDKNKAPVLAIDPPAQGIPGVVSKFAIVPVLPYAHAQNNGKIYLCNLGFPLSVFNEVGIKYKSPFGAKFLIPLHPNDS